MGRSNLPFSFFSGARCRVVDVVRGSDGPVDAWTRAGLIGNIGEIPDEGGRGPEYVTPGLPSHDCILLVTSKNRRYRPHSSSRRSSQG